MKLIIYSVQFPAFGEIVANSDCRLFILWLLYCFCLSFPSVLEPWCRSDCISSWVLLFTFLYLYPLKINVLPKWMMFCRRSFHPFPFTLSPVVTMIFATEKTRLNICAKNKGANQPARQPRLISAFVVRCSSFFFFFFLFFFFEKKRLTNLNGEQNDTWNLLVSHWICHFRAIQPLIFYVNIYIHSQKRILFGYYTFSQNEWYIVYVLPKWMTPQWWV